MNDDNGVVDLEKAREEHERKKREEHLGSFKGTEDEKETKLPTAPIERDGFYQMKIADCYPYWSERYEKWQLVIQGVLVEVPYEVKAVARYYDYPGRKSKDKHGDPVHKRGAPPENPVFRADSEYRRMFLEVMGRRWYEENGRSLAPKHLMGKMVMAYCSRRRSDRGWWYTVCIEILTRSRFVERARMDPERYKRVDLEFR